MLEALYRLYSSAFLDELEKAARLPQAERILEKGYEVLYLTDDVDEFALKMPGKYADKEFKNVSDESLDIVSNEEKNVARIEEGHLWK